MEEERDPNPITLPLRAKLRLSLQPSSPRPVGHVLDLWMAFCRNIPTKRKQQIGIFIRINAARERKPPRFEGFFGELDDSAGDVVGLFQIGSPDESGSCCLPGHSV